MTDLLELQKKFSHNNHIVFEKKVDEIVLANIDSPLATATVSLYGGQILHWQPKCQSEPVLWSSERIKFQSGKAIRAGVPICWPWFGAHPDKSDKPAHGYARLSSWQLDSVSTTQSGEIELCLSMGAADLRYKDLNFNADLALRILIGQKLSLTLTTTNTSHKPLVLTEAFHAYFKVRDISEINITGLNECQYIDLLEANTLKTQAGTIDFTGELGRVYLNTTSACCIEDRALGRKIRISKSQSLSTVVWNPWLLTASKMDDLGSTGWRGMVCVETANAFANAVTIAPGEKHAMGVTYAVENLSVYT